MTLPGWPVLMSLCVKLVSESFMHCHLHHTLVSQVTKGLMLVEKETRRQDFYMLTCLVHIIQVSSHTGKVTCLTRNCLLLKLLARTQDRATPRVCLRVTQRHIGLGVFHTLSHRVTLLNTVLHRAGSLSHCVTCVLHAAMLHKQTCDDVTEGTYYGL